jgi:hypothetical protein
LHDALWFHCPLALAEECRVNVKREMERPSTVMLMPDGSGFSVEVEIKQGLNWSALKEVSA